MSEYKTYSSIHAIAEIAKTLTEIELGHTASRDQVARTISLALLDLHSSMGLKRPKNLSTKESVITEEMLRSLTLADCEYKGTVFSPSHRRLINGDEWIQLGHRESTMIRPLFAFPNHLMVKELFLTHVWGYPPELLRFGKTTYGSGLNRMRTGLSKIQSEAKIITVSGVGIKLE